LSLAGYETDGLRLVIESNPDRYPAPLVSSMLGHLQQLLIGMGAAGPDGNIADLAIVSAAERADLIDHAGFDPVEPACFPDLVEAVVARQADAPAVAAIDDERTLTYRAFDTAANRLAHDLIERGVGHGDRVAVCLPRSLDYAVAIMAVHKAQAAFVPLDPGYPPQALAHMVADSGAQVLLTTAAVMDGAGLVVDAGAVEVVAVDALDTEHRPATAPDRPDLGPDSLAYIIYTSGSTGVPKGVRIGHRQLTSHNDAFRRGFVDVGPGDRVLQFAALSFDTSIEEITPTWSSGGELVLRDDEMAYAIPHFLEVVGRQRLTILNLPTAFWHELVRHLDERDQQLPDSVRSVIIGGEKAAIGSCTVAEIVHSVGP
ncbi:MAG: AMP-binding protein, partial [Actinomycetota bacterium]